MEASRQLAAIMFTDIVGYSALMGIDEEKALHVLNKNRVIHKSVIARYRGKWLKEMGDGTLSSFNASSAAARCAAAILSEAHREGIALRIGIHVGEVLFKDNDVFGEDVNISSRIQEIASPGSIWVSESVHKNLVNKKGIETTFIKEAQLKNIKGSKRIYEVHVQNVETLAVQTKPVSTYTKHTRFLWTTIAVAIILVMGLLLKNDFWGMVKVNRRNVEKSIAVLPFQNESSNQENQYFCNGMMDAILNHLSKIEDLRVVPRTSVEQYRTNLSTAKQIGKKLNVKYILEGSVLRLEENARIFVRLVDSHRETQIWSHEFDRDLKDIFSVQSDITQTIADNLQAIIDPEVKNRIEIIPTSDPIAHDYYLQGNEYLFQANQWTQTNQNWKALLDRAEVSYELSLDRDSSYAEAKIGLARVKFKKNEDVSTLVEGYLDDVLLLVNQALDINPYLSDAYLLRSQIHQANARITMAQQDLEQALDLKPNSVQALYAQFNMLRNHDFNFVGAINSLSHIQQLVRSEDDRWQLYDAYYLIYLQLGDFEMAEFYGDMKKELKPNKTFNLIQLYESTGRRDDALNAINQYPEDNQFKILFLGKHFLYGREYRTAVSYFQQWDQLVTEQSANNIFSISDFGRYGHALIETGQREKGIEFIQMQIATNLRKYTLQQGNWISGAIYDLAGMYSVLGQKDSAYYWLQELDKNNGWLSFCWSDFIKHDVQFDNIKQDQRFKEIISNADLQQEKQRKMVREFIASETYQN